jgi:tetratricopeptide (TPR) repeat protein
MTRTTFRLGLTLLSSGIAVAQGPPTAIQETRAATLPDLRGLNEALDIPTAVDRADGSTMWSALTQDPGPRPLIASRAMVGAVSAKQLRHPPPKAARQAYEKALKLTQNKDAQRAMSELEKAIALDPEFPEAHCDLGASYALLGRYPEAEAEFRRAIELIPENSIPRYNLALLLLATGRSGEAEANIRQAIQFSPDAPKAHMLLGEMLAVSPITRMEGVSHLHYAARTIPEAKRMLEALGEHEHFEGAAKMASPKQ